MANELVSGVTPYGVSAATGGSPAGGMDDPFGVLAVGQVHGVAFRPNLVGEAWFVRRIPNAAALGTGLTVELIGAEDSLNADPAKVVLFGVTVGPLASSGVLGPTSVSGSTEVTGTLSPPATAGTLITGSIAVASANLNSLAAGQWAMFRVRRKGTATADTCKGTFVLLGVDVRNT